MLFIYTLYTFYILKYYVSICLFICLIELSLFLHSITFSISYLSFITLLFVSKQVRDVVGPPYSIHSIEPKIGAVTGATECIVHGMGFLGSKGDARLVEWGGVRWCLFSGGRVRWCLFVAVFVFYL
jgi:hypothetical protein